jgi:hypothetical protein
MATAVGRRTARECKREVQLAHFPRRSSTSFLLGSALPTNVIARGLPRSQTRCKHPEHDQGHGRAPDNTKVRADLDWMPCGGIRSHSATPPSPNFKTGAAVDPAGRVRFPSASATRGDASPWIQGGSIGAVIQRLLPTFCPHQRPGQPFAEPHRRIKLSTCTSPSNHRRGRRR